MVIILVLKRLSFAQYQVDSTLTYFELEYLQKKRRGRGHMSPKTVLDYFCLRRTKPPTRITTAAPTAPATIARVASKVGTSVVVVVVPVVVVVGSVGSGLSGA